MSMSHDWISRFRTIGSSQAGAAPATPPDAVPIASGRSVRSFWCFAPENRGRAKPDVLGAWDDDVHGAGRDEQEPAAEPAGPHGEHAVVEDAFDESEAAGAAVDAVAVAVGEPVGAVERAVHLGRLDAIRGWASRCPQLPAQR